jgi:hypothetical protein
MGRGNFGPLNMALLLAAVFGGGLFVLVDELERIPVRFEHSLHGERSFCILVG